MATLGPIRLAPGYRRTHALTLLYAAFITIGLLVFMSFMQPYLLTANLALPPAVQGRTVAYLNIANEIVALLLVAPLGALADRIGRRRVYAAGLLWVGAGFAIYPLASTLPQLFAAALFFSAGVAAIGTMLATVMADTPRDESRGKLVGLAGFFQGLGAMLFVAVLGGIPAWLHRRGVSDIDASRYTLWLVALVCLASAIVVSRGLKAGTPRKSAQGTPLRLILREGASAARGNPRIWFAYLLQFTSFADRVVIGTFLTLRLQQEWLARGVGVAEATQKARLPYIIALAAALAATVLIGVVIDRVDRLRFACVALGITVVAYGAGALIVDPTRTAIVMTAAVLLGIGQVAAIIASQTLLGQEAPRSARGAVIGLGGIFASLGILVTNGAGGWLYDTVNKSGPFLLVAAMNLVILLIGLRLLGSGTSSGKRPLWAKWRSGRDSNPRPPA